MAEDTERAGGMSDTEWHDWRRQGVGGSDIPGLIGLSRYASPTSLYYEKLGLLEPSDETERQRINASREAAANSEAAGVVKAGMQFPLFWVAWSIAALPTAAWFGWGMADSLFNGTLSDVAALPPQLKEYADIVFGNACVFHRL